MPSARFAPAFFFAALTLCLAACDELDGTATHDQTWFVRYLVENNSSRDLVLRWGSEIFRGPSTPISVAAGETKEIQYYEEFLGPPPDAGRSFTCISVYQSSDSILVFQLTPVKNRQFSFRELRKYHVEYTLRLDDSKLELGGRTNMCATLSGITIDSLTMSILSGLHVAFQDSVSGSAMRTNTMDNTEYFFMWSGDIPHGSVYFLKSRYRPLLRTVPEHVEDAGDRHYRMHAVLVPDTIR